MKLRKLLLLTTLPPLLAFGLAAGVAWVSRRPVEVGPVEGELRPTPSTPNGVCSQGPGANIEPFPMLEGEAAASRTQAALVDLLSAEPRASVRTAEEGYVHAVFWTPFLRFADDVEFLVSPAEGVVHVRSASRIGYSDLGANRARLEDLRVRWRSRLTRQADTGDSPR